MNLCNHLHTDGVMHTPCPHCKIESLEEQLAAMTAVLEERDDMILSQAEGLSAAQARIVGLREALLMVIKKSPWNDLDKWAKNAIDELHKPDNTDAIWDVGPHCIDEIRSMK